MTAERGIPSLHYVCQTEQHHLTLSVQQGNAMRIESWFPQSGERSVLEQPALGKLTWEHALGDLTDQYEGTNLLHLRHASARTFDQHFGVLIQRLLRGQSLQSLSDATERAMLCDLQKSPSLDTEQIRLCVEQLRAARRATRVQAERQLLAWGTPVIPVLQEMCEGDVDSEQQERMRRVLQRLRPMVDDTPATLGKLLINDRSYWTRIAANLESDQLRLANGYLVNVGIRPVELPNEPVTRVATTRE